MQDLFNWISYVVEPNVVNHHENSESSSESVDPSLAAALKILALSSPIDSTLLTSLEYARIKAELPAHLRFDEWRLLYSLSQHGASLRSLYRRTSCSGPVVLVVKPSGGAACGAYLDIDGLYTHNSSYFGGRNSFVFRLVAPENVEAFHSSGTNEWYVLCTDQAIGIGGGDHFAIHIDKDLLTCSSGQCETFSSPALVEHGADLFECVDIEIWAVAEKA